MKALNFIFFNRLRAMVIFLLMHLKLISEQNKKIDLSDFNQIISNNTELDKWIQKAPEINISSA